jgi:predicted DNA-binding transcriptional regulator AlpA
MTKRLIDWRTINAEKIKRGRSWIFAEMSAGRFPPPVVRGRGSNLWDEADVDRWLAEFADQGGKREPVNV